MDAYNKHCWPGVAKRIPFVSLTLGCIALLLHGLSDVTALALQVDSVSLSSVFTSHWVHWSTEHLMWSGGAFIVLGCWCEMRSRERYLGCLFSSSVLIAMAVATIPGPYEFYGGLSGIDSALFGLLLSERMRANRHPGDSTERALAITLGTGFVAKVAYEYISNQAFFVASTENMVPVPIAHLAGFVAGVLGGLSGTVKEERE